MYTGHRISATTPWTMRSWNLGVRSTMGDTIARPYPLHIHVFRHHSTIPRSSHRGPAAARYSFVRLASRPQLPRNGARQLASRRTRLTAAHCTERFVQAGLSRATALATHLYLIDCRRVCYFCFTRRAEYFPLTSREASKFFPPPPDARP
ncbi:hypothetical protein FPV67DRAFT_304582 [Lyophyllum atratum]|nr:hypothetical protein FPV67DRAFT_304582 [Lyophyllum atratum]